ncbi:MAG: beta-phosphoglucomutase [Bacteroidetes bacterium]|nr:beta-phosphoglucomutase [Bacteroidota bacterium]
MILQPITEFINQHSYPEFKLKAVLFDMDGVLFDSMPAHAEAWVRAIRKIGLPFTHYEAYMHEGRTGTGTINGIFQREWGRSATSEEEKAIYTHKSKEFRELSRTIPMPFAGELLNKLKNKGLDIILVTGSGQASLLDSLEVYYPGIFCQEKMVTAFDVKYGKPNPEPYLMGLQKAGVKPWEAVVVENAPLGVEAAKGAGIFTVAINTGILEDEVLVDAGANIVLPGMQELYNEWDILF